MNTRVVKSFGLALVVAVGILALMLALGTFQLPRRQGRMSTATCRCRWILPRRVRTSK